MKKKKKKNTIEWLCKRLLKGLLRVYKTARLENPSFDRFWSCEKNKVPTQTSFASQDKPVKNVSWQTLAQAKNQAPFWS
jgi:hypothetical protein